jgi:aminoglycoside 3-N-acetyltransferase
MLINSSPHTRDRLVSGLAALGLDAGDTVLVRAALKAIGETAEPVATALIAALLDVLGPEGTVVGLSFTPASPVWRKDNSYIFRPSQPSLTGGFAAAMTEWPGAARSRHPTNSFVAIGARAVELLADHDHRTPCFYPMNKIVEWKGKMVLVGCAASSPGFSTVHLAQEHLGLSTQTVFPGMFGTLFEHDGEIDWFRRLDEPGCSMGFSKFYADYVRTGLLRIANVGDAYSLGVPAAPAYALERSLLENDRTAALCDRRDCFACRGIWRYNWRDLPTYWLKALSSGVSGKLRRR